MRVIVNCRAGHCSSGRHSSLHLGVRHQEKKKKKTEQRAEQRRRQRGESSGAGDTQHPHFQAEIPGQNALNLRIYLFQKPNKCICKYCIKRIWEKIYFSSFFVANSRSSSTCITQLFLKVDFLLKLTRFDQLFYNNCGLILLFIIHN